MPALSMEPHQPGPLSPIAPPIIVGHHQEESAFEPAVKAVENRDAPSVATTAVKGKEEPVFIEPELYRYELPRTHLPPSNELEPVETFVSNAIQSQLQENPDPGHVDGFRAIADSLRRPEDPKMLYMVLVALRTAGKGSTLYQMATVNEKFSMLTHLIFKFNPFHIPDKMKEEKEESFYSVYRDWSMADAHFRLILALVSAKSVHVLPALTAVWRILTANRTAAKEPM